MPAAGERARSPRGAPSSGREAARRAPDEGEPPASPRAAPGGGGSAQGRPLNRRRIAPRGSGCAGGVAFSLAAAPAPAGHREAAAAEKFHGQLPRGAVKMGEASQGPGDAPCGAGLPPRRASGRRRGRCWGRRSGSSCPEPERPTPLAIANRPVVALRLLCRRGEPAAGCPGRITPPEPRTERGSAYAQLLALRPRQRHSGHRALMNIYSERRRAPPPSPAPPISRALEGNGGAGPSPR